MIWGYSITVKIWIICSIEELKQENGRLKTKIKKLSKKTANLKFNKERVETIIAENNLKSSLVETMTDGCNVNLREIQNDISHNLEVINEINKMVEQSSNIIKLLYKISKEMFSTVDDMAQTSSRTRGVANNLNGSMGDISGVISLIKDISDQNKSSCTKCCYRSSKGRRTW